MTDGDPIRGKATVRGGNTKGSATVTEIPLTPKPQKLDRTREQLEPLAKLISENASIMDLFYRARGSNNEELGREAIDKIRQYAQALDSSVSYTEGARLILVLEEMFPR